MMRRILIPALALAAGGCAVGAFEGPRSVAPGNTAFGLELYSKLREKDGNLICSPYSASAALAMTSAGARGETAAEMARVLHLPGDRDQAHPAFGALSRELAAADGAGSRLAIANSLWGQQGVPWARDFLDLAKSSYGAGLREVDFEHDPETARKTINEWVERQTQDKIKELFAPRTLTSDTRLALVNAVYFKGDWASKFPARMTLEGDFRTAGGPVKAPMMNQTGKFRLYEDSNVQALELPYRGDRLSMVVVLPRQADGLAGVEQGLTPGQLDGWLGGLKAVPLVRVALPKFKITSSFDLIPPLEALGMEAPFGPRADFSGMASSEKLFISVVVQKAFVEVNEEGTEAAAATGVALSRSASGPRPVVFNADHPFLFLIRDNQTGTVLFLGRVVNPNG
jgi:serpin B